MRVSLHDFSIKSLTSRLRHLARAREEKYEVFCVAYSPQRANRFIANGRKLFRDAITMIYRCKVLVRECHRAENINKSAAR